MIELDLNVGEETNFDGSWTQTVILNEVGYRVRYSGQEFLSWTIDHNIGLVNAVMVYKDGEVVLAFAAKPNILINDNNTHTLTIHLLERHHQRLEAL